MRLTPVVFAGLTAKTARTFCYGFLGILLPVHLAELGLTAPGIELAVTLTLAPAPSSQTLPDRDRVRPHCRRRGWVSVPAAAALDVPTWQAWVMAIVEDHEREAAGAATNLARTVAAAVTPALTGWVMQSVALSAPFGGLRKMTYDLLLWTMFRHVKLTDPG